MAQYDALLSGGSDIARIRQDMNDPGRLFRGATWDQIGVDAELTEFLATSFSVIQNKQENRGVEVNVALLKSRIAEHAISARGNVAWRAIYGIPAEHPSNITQHQFQNLIERLYLSSPQGQGSKPLFTESLPSRDERDKVIFHRSASFAAAGVLLAGCAWLIYRRAALSESSSMLHPAVHNADALLPAAPDPSREVLVDEAQMSQPNSAEVKASSNASKGFFWRLVSGDYGLARTYWRYGVLTTALAGWIARAIDSVTPALGLVLHVALMGYVILCLVGVWRAADRYHGPVLWVLLARGAVIASIMSAAFLAALVQVG